MKKNVFDKVIEAKENLDVCISNAAIQIALMLSIGATLKQEEGKKFIKLGNKEIEIPSMVITHMRTNKMLSVPETKSITTRRNSIGMRGYRSDLGPNGRKESV